MEATKISRELAEQEFESYCTANGIACDEAVMGDDDKRSFEPIKKRFVAACVEGRVVVDGPKLKYTLSDYSPHGYAGKEITVNRPSGKAFLAMDGKGDNQRMLQLQSFCSAITGEPGSFFSIIDIEDWSFFSGVVTLFLSR